MRNVVLRAAAILLAAGAAGSAQAQAEPFIGQFAWVPYNFAPRGWHFCDGSILPIAQNTALFSLLGTTYGGDGVTTFALPDLRGRVMISSGQGPGLTNHDLGEFAGAESVTLTTDQMPAHTHALNATTKNGQKRTPEGNLPAFITQTDGVTMAASDQRPYRTGSPDTTMSAEAIGSAGGSQPVGILPPYLTVNCIIALEGIFPSRN